MLRMWETTVFNWDVARTQLFERNWTSPEIIIGTENITKWIVHQDKKDDPSLVCLTFRNIEAGKIPVNLKVIFSVWDENMKKISSKTGTMKGVATGSEINLCNFSIHSSTSPLSSRHFLLIHCEIRDLEIKHGRRQILVCPCINDRQVLKPTDSIYKDFLHDKLFSDVLLLLGEKKYQAHKLVLVANSPVFYRMFSHEMKETISKEVEIKEMEEEVFEALLEYMYTKKVNGLEKLDSELLVAAERYEMEELKMICEHEMLKKLCLDNVMEFIIIADTHNAVNLMKHCYSFVMRNFDNCTVMNHFMVLGKTHPQVLVELCQGLATQCKLQMKF